MGIIARIIRYLISRIAAKNARRRPRRRQETAELITTETISVAVAAVSPPAYRPRHRTAACRTPGPRPSVGGLEAKAEIACGPADGRVTISEHRREAFVAVAERCTLHNSIRQPLQIRIGIETAVEAA
jgi:hypothetical protein